MLIWFLLINTIHPLPQIGEQAFRIAVFDVGTGRLETGLDLFLGDEPLCVVFLPLLDPALHPFLG